MLTRDQILEAVWDYTFAGNASVLETYISYLRHKIDGDGEVPLIHTVRGVGYSLRLPAGTELRLTAVRAVPLRRVAHRPRAVGQPCSRWVPSGHRIPR